MADTTCATCGGTGTVLADHTDRRKGDRTCPNCGGLGLTLVSPTTVQEVA